MYFKIKYFLNFCQNPFTHDTRTLNLKKSLKAYSTPTFKSRIFCLHNFDFQNAILMIEIAKNEVGNCGK